MSWASIVGRTARTIAKDEKKVVRRSDPVTSWASVVGRTARPSLAEEKKVTQQTTPGVSRLLGSWPVIPPSEECEPILLERYLLPPLVGIVCDYLEDIDWSAEVSSEIQRLNLSQYAAWDNDEGVPVHPQQGDIVYYLDMEDNFKVPVFRQMKACRTNNLWIRGGLHVELFGIGDS